MMMGRICAPAVSLVPALTALPAPAPSTPARVLFIGNSYTGANDLPGIFRAILESAGRPVPHIEAVTPGGKTLQEHLSLPDTLAKIDKGGWDVAVLQGQSQEAALAEQADDIRARFLAGAAGLYDRIKAGSPGARIVFYETWARHADYWKDPAPDTAVGRDPAEMQARIRKWYQRAAARPDAAVAPVGDAWELNYNDPQAVRLHVRDNSHPAFNGSYLAGLVLYAAIYGATNLHVGYHGGLTDAEAAYLQRLAAQAAQGERR